MTGKTHILIGLATGAGVALVSSAALPAGLACIGAAGVGAMLPDIDSPNSKISRQVGILRWLIFWIPHRTLTHSLLAMALVGIVGYLAGIIGVAFAAGYASHVAADMLTTSGIPLFYPVWDRRFHLLPPLLRLTTGGLVESGFALLTIAALVYLVALFLRLIQPITFGV